jgi:hypothetical protein
MIDELELVRQARPDIQAPGGEAREAARQALDRAIAGQSGPVASRRSVGSLRRALPAFGVLIAIAIVVVFLSLRGHTPTHSTGTTSSAVSTTPAGSTTSAEGPPQEQTPLTGTWTGHYSGAYTGTLTIDWQQSGWKEISRGVFHSNLGGSIQLSSPPETLSIHGTVLTSCPTAPCNTPDAVRFNTVGASRITYVGTVGHPGMSGTYRTTAGASGSWSANQAGP